MKEFTEEEKVNLNVGLKVVDFYADWCGPCKNLIPKLETLSQDYDIDFIKINVDKNIDLSMKTYSIKSVPTVLILKDGEIKVRLTGDKDIQQYKIAIEEHL